MSETTKMDPILRAKWVTALRSGDVEQARGYMLDPKSGGFCCLGVLALVQGVTRDDMAANDWTGVGNCPLALEHAVIWKVRAELADMNDNGKTFPEIADWIGANL